MGATIKVIAKGPANAQGELPLYLQVIINRKKNLKALNLYVKPNQWDKESGTVKKNHPASVNFNTRLANKKSEAMKVLNDALNSNENVDSKEIKILLKGKPTYSFFVLSDEYTARAVAEGRIGTARRAKGTFSKLKEYLNDRDLKLSEINYEFLRRYETYLTTELSNSTNTISANFKLIKTVLNEAIKRGQLSMDKNPFLHYELKNEVTNREYLTSDELTRIEKLDLKAYPVMDLSRDIYVFSAYAAGLRISDVLTLRWNNFDGSHITIFIRKTKIPHSIFLLDEAKEIIAKYKSQDRVNNNDYIFPKIKSSIDSTDPSLMHKAISSATASINENLKEIAKKSKVNKRVTMHTSRHTFATQSLKNGGNVAHISKLLGHANLRETQVYAKIANPEMDEAIKMFKKYK